ncbi:MAG: hypothetical protein N3E42_00745 [Candidatus Bipolaricaulota bacterium]|nr:hypothetical protein [Candidatus Bipolaricaulota bacterium]
MAAPKKQLAECEYRGPWVVSRDIQIGQTCWHPLNLKEGRTHLLSKSCEEWGEDCPRQRAHAQDR